MPLFKGDARRSAPDWDALLKLVYAFGSAKHGRQAQASADSYAADKAALEEEIKRQTDEEWKKRYGSHWEAYTQQGIPWTW